MTSEKCPIRQASAILFDEISRSRNGLRRSNAQRVKDACDEIERDKLGISAAEVARRCQNTGPAYSSISNKGSQLGDYVRSRINEQVLSKIDRSTSSDSFADQITDPVLQTLVRDRESKSKWLTKENNGLRTLLKNLSPGIDIDDLLRSPFEKFNGQKTGTTEVSELTPSASSDAIIKLLKHLINERNYRLINGRLTINGKIVLSGNELDNLRMAAGLNIDEWNNRFTH